MAANKMRRCDCCEERVQDSWFCENCGTKRCEPKTPTRRDATKALSGGYIAIFVIFYWALKVLFCLFGDHFFNWLDGPGSWGTFWIYAAITVALIVASFIVATESFYRKNLEKEAGQKEKRKQAETRYKLAKKREAEEEKRAVELEEAKLAQEQAKALDHLSERTDEIAACVAKFDHHDHFESGYLMKRSYDELIKEAKPSVDCIEKISEDLWSLHENPQLIRKLLFYYDADYRDERNARYKKHELGQWGHLLDDIDGKKLDDQQRDAVVTDEYSNLVIAGAGSGKTLTVVGKIKYLVERWNIDPAEILVTSFTRKSVDELTGRIERAGIQGVTAKNFHALGLGILGTVGVANDNELKNCIVRYLRSEILSSPKQVQAYLEFYGCYSALLQDSAEPESIGEQFENLKSEDIVTIKGRLIEIADERKADHSTLQGEKVSSLEELIIANFLFLNGVNYEYEKTYSGDYDKSGRAYQPDFYLNDYDIWLEHFGISKDGRVPWIKTEYEEKKYRDGIIWKRETHKKNGTNLIESYSFWNDDNGLLRRLEGLLTANGVELHEDVEHLANLYNQLKEDEGFSKSIIDLISTFISLFKANNFRVEEVDRRAAAVYGADGFMRHRYDLFMTFVEPMIHSYRATLEAKNQVDFDDMINHATEVVKRGGIDVQYHYIIVDEYQDISMSRFGLIHAIREATDAKLICVGDDWQSIYRFAGSDVTLFTNFDSFSGDHEKLKIEQTYRNSQELVDTASSFIMKNNQQLPKTMKSGKAKEFPITVVTMKSQQEALEVALEQILNSSNYYQGEILILGRHNSDLSKLFADIKGDQWQNVQSGYFTFCKDRDSGDILIKYKDYPNIKFMSVHRAKGLEADDVIVLNLINDKYGFPNKIVDDPILNLLLGASDEYRYAEERRLFYVALTRTENSVYLITNSSDDYKASSSFIKELVEEFKDKSLTVISDEPERSPAACPYCEGVLVVRKNRQMKEFLGCTNYPFCKKTYSHIAILESQVRCPKCEGWMVKRSGKHGEFYGCTNYPECRGTADIVSAEIVEDIPF